MAEMNPDYKPPSGTEDRQGKNVIPVNDEPKPSTSKASRAKKSKVPKQEEIKGGGGKDSDHGRTFHLEVAQSLLFKLKSMYEADYGFKFDISLEKEGYGVFDDIVVRYKKSNGKWTEICIQCKHAAGSKKTVSAGDFLTDNVKRKDFRLAECINTVTAIEKREEKCDRYYLFISNRAYADTQDSKYPYFKRGEIESHLKKKTLLEDIFQNGFKVESNNELYKQLCTQLQSKNLDETKVSQFFDKFLYIFDDVNLSNELHKNIVKHCGDNEEKIQSLKDRLSCVVSEMYCHTYCPDQKQLLNIFYGDSINYKVKNAHPHFKGRSQELNIMEKALVGPKGRQMLDISIVGLAGMGKTQFVRKFIEEYVSGKKKSFKHVIWINAESKESLEETFFDLLKYCHLKNINGEDNINILNVTKEVFSYFREDTLFVFDNTNQVLLTRNDKEEYLYLPNYEGIKTTKFIVISQEKGWTTNGKPVVIDKFSEEHALQYLNATLLKCSDDDKRKLAKMLQYWPLALSLTVSFIRSQTTESFGQKSVSHVIESLENNLKKVYAHSPNDKEMEDYQINLYSLWKIIERNLAKHELALKIIEIMSFSDPDNFSLDLLKFKNFTEDEVRRAASLLRDNSIITDSENTMSIHHILQSVIRDSITSDPERYERTLLLGTECIEKYLESMNDNENCQGNNHMVTFLCQLIKSEIGMEKYVKVANILLHKLIRSGDLSSHCSSDGIFSKMVVATQQKLGRRNIHSLITLLKKAEMLMKTGQFKNSLQILDDLINVCNELSIRKNLFYQCIMEIKGTVLRNMGQYKVSLNIFENRLKACIRRFGIDDRYTLNIMQEKAYVLQCMEKHEEALYIYNKVIGVRLKKLGLPHRDIIDSMKKKADVHEAMTNYEDSLSVHDEIIEALDFNHPDSLRSMSSKAKILQNIKEYGNALTIYIQVTKARIQKLGINHPQTLDSMMSKAVVLEKMKKFEEALIVFNQIIEVTSKHYGLNHPYTLIPMLNKAIVLESIGNHEESLIICNRLIELSEESGNLFITNESTDLKSRVLNMIRKIERIEKYIGVSYQHNIHLRDACTYMAQRVVFFLRYGLYANAAEIFFVGFHMYSRFSVPDFKSYFFIILQACVWGFVILFLYLFYLFIL